DMFTFYAGNSEPSRIDLYVNEKKNPISPLLVSSGAQGVSAQISASFTRALSEVSFGLIETASDFFNEAETQQALDSIEKRTASARDQLLSIADTVDALASLTESSVPLVDSAERISAALGDSLDQVRPADLGATGAGLNGDGAALAAALAATSESFAAVSDRVDQLMADSSATSQATAASLT
ncbi:YhgE/Pip domain-containing protein, partial [Corynebacterium sanguinis]|nr:YhgE/Pip domain-containing protein [Corynebacterium sanguinis]